MITCKRDDCTKEAVTALAIEIYPHKAVMQHYGTTQPLTTIVLGLELCDEHAQEACDTGAIALMGESTLKALAGVAECSSGTQADLSASKLVRLSLTDPTYTLLKKQRESK